MPTIRTRHRQPNMAGPETVSTPSGRQTVWNHHDNQDPADQHGAKYDNDTDGWVAGARGAVTCENEDATHKPGFDHGGSWRMRNKGNDWRK